VKQKNRGTAVGVGTDDGGDNEPIGEETEATTHRVGSTICGVGGTELSRK